MIIGTPGARKLTVRFRDDDPEDAVSILTDLIDNVASRIEGAARENLEKLKRRREEIDGELRARAEEEGEVAAHVGYAGMEASSLLKVLRDMSKEVETLTAAANKLPIEIARAKASAEAIQELLAKEAEAQGKAKKGDPVLAELGTLVMIAQENLVEGETLFRKGMLSREELNKRMGQLAEAKIALLQREEEIRSRVANSATINLRDELVASEISLARSMAKLEEDRKRLEKLKGKMEQVAPFRQRLEPIVFDMDRLREDRRRVENQIREATSQVSTLTVLVEPTLRVMPKADWDE